MTVFKKHEKFFFTLVLFLLTDKFSHFINFLSRHPYVRYWINFLFDIPLNNASIAFRTWSKAVLSLSMDAAFWFVILMALFHPRFLNRIYWVFRKNAPVILLLILAGASWFWSVAPNNTLNGFYLALKITVVGIYVSQVYSSEEILDILVGVVALASVLSILVIWQIPEQGISGRYWQGIYSFKNYMGRLMAFGNVMLIIYWINNGGTVFKRILTLLLIILTGILLIFSDSATSLISLVGMYGALIAFGVWKKWNINMRPRIRYSLILFAVILAILVIWNSEVILSLFGRSGSMSVRVELWQVLWTWFQERPLLGIGYGAFWVQLPEDILSTYGQVLKHAHNGYIEVVLGLGLSGLTAFLLALIIVWKRALILLRQQGSLIFFWPILVLLYFTLANFTYSIAFEMPDFHWLLFIVVAGLVTPSESKRLDNSSLDMPTLR